MPFTFQPDNLYEFGARYFAQLATATQGGGGGGGGGPAFSNGSGGSSSGGDGQ
jgi:hypothetical protein